jgi:hypothetical protein
VVTVWREIIKPPAATFLHYPPALDCGPARTGLRVCTGAALLYKNAQRQKTPAGNADHKIKRNASHDKV